MIKVEKFKMSLYKDENFIIYKTHLKLKTLKDNVKGNEKNVPCLQGGSKDG